MKTIIIFCVLLISESVFAQQIYELSSITILSDEVQYLNDGTKAMFTGNVVAVGDNFTLTADRMDAVLGNNSTIRSVDCMNNVYFKSLDMLAISNKANINTVSNMITMLGGVKVWKGESYLEGELVEMRYETNEFYIHKGGLDKVIVILNPENRK
jgi:lipopolysaccharide transport protein LptA